MDSPHGEPGTCHSGRMMTFVTSLPPCSEYAKSFICSEKTAYIAKYGIASFIKRELLRRVGEKSYVLIFDKSMNTTTKSKQMDVHLRYWITDESSSAIIDRNSWATPESRTC